MSRGSLLISPASINCATAPELLWRRIATRRRVAVTTRTARSRRTRVRLTGAAFSPDGKLLVTASADKSARLWHVAGTKPLPCGLPKYPARTGRLLSLRRIKPAGGLMRGLPGALRYPSYVALQRIERPVRPAASQILIGTPTKAPHKVAAVQPLAIRAARAEEALSDCPPGRYAACPAPAGLFLSSQRLFKSSVPSRSVLARRCSRDTATLDAWITCASMPRALSQREPEAVAASSSRSNRGRTVPPARRAADHRSHRGQE
jgi:hypothetical protein